MTRTHALALALVATGCLSKPEPPGGGNTDVPQFDPKLAVGQNHACAIDNAGALWCWGYNAYGQAAPGTDMSVLVPTRVGSMTGWTSVVAGNNHTCGMLNGAVRCWGENNVEQTSGSDADTDLVMPGFVPVSLFGQSDGTCALDAAGRMMCWGEPSLDPATPALVDPGGKGLAFSQVAANPDHACALTVDGAVYCWGSNEQKQLGVDTGSANSILPAAAKARPNTYLAIAVAGPTTCGLTAAHSIECWGSVDSPLFNDIEGRLDAMTAWMGTIVEATRTWDTFTMGGDFVCGNAGGSVGCYGYGNHGQLGDGFDSHDLGTTPVFDSAIGLAAGDEFACAHTADGHVSCWGQNRFGNLGTGEIARSEPVAIVASPMTVVGDVFGTITTGERHACALTSSGELYCWGDNRDKQVDPDDPEKYVVTPRKLSMTVKQVSAGADHTCAILEPSHDAVCWGSNKYQQLGTTGDSVHTKTLAGPWTWISAGGVSSCGVSAGAISCWGFVPGQAPDSATALPPMAVIPAPGTGPWTQVEVGDSHVIATDNMKVVGFGYGCDAVGSGSTSQYGHDASDVVLFTAPKPVVNVPGGVTDLSVARGGDDSCAHVDGTVYCWGENKAGELAQNDSGSGPCIGATPLQNPMIPYGMTDVNYPGGTLSLYGHHGCVMTNDASAECWGDNADLPIGIRPGNANARAIIEAYGATKLSDLAVGPTYTCGIGSSTDPSVSVWCWGTSVHGELGNGRRFQDKPVLTMFVP